MNVHCVRLMICMLSAINARVPTWAYLSRQAAHLRVRNFCCCYAGWCFTRQSIYRLLGLFQLAKYHRFDALWDWKEGKINALQDTFCPLFSPTMLQIYAILLFGINLIMVIVYIKFIPISKKSQVWCIVGFKRGQNKCIKGNILPS